MLTIALSVLFGLIAYASLVVTYSAVVKGVHRGRAILGELAQGERGTRLKGSQPVEFSPQAL